MRILYIYAGTREGRRSTSGEFDGPRTQWYGLPALKEMGFDVSYKEFIDVYPDFLARILPFNIRHMLMYFPARKYDIVFGSALIPMMFLKAFFGGKSKFILLNISLTRVITSQKKGGLKAKLILFAMSRLDGIVCLSETQRRFIVEKTGFPKEKVFAVPFGVDTLFYTRGITADGGTILSVGRDNGRDYKTVFDVAERLPEKKFIVICSRRNIAGLVVPKNVSVIYDLAPQKVLELYRRAKVLLLLTHGDSYSDGADCSGQTVLLEAMATGLPAIVSSNPCLLEYISDDDDSLIVSYHDVSAIVSAIKKLDDPIKRGSLSHAAERLVKMKYSEGEMAKSLASVFQKVKISS